MSTAVTQPCNPSFPFFGWCRKLVDQSRHYHLQSQWTVGAQVSDVADVFLNSSLLPVWWPQFRCANVIAPGNDRAEGRVFDVVTKGFMPYHLEFQLHILEVDYPGYFRLRSTGDFEGTATGRLQQSDHNVHIHFDWRIEVRKPMLRLLSPVCRPFFVGNHRWIMGFGERSLRRHFRQRAA